MAKRAAGKQLSSNKRQDDEWWKTTLEGEECPITLESLAHLPYPPFALSSKAGNAVTTYFDGVALASYVISRGIFENPLTRQELNHGDCQRLDDHLTEHCADYLQGIGGARQISVTEAYSLRSIVNVEGEGTLNRARILRNTATAALAGLFVYGNDRRRRLQQPQQEATGVVAELPREDRLILEWGFDLSKQVEETAEYGGNGWTVIDDDEALVVASKREAYQATQNAFPRLSDDSISDTSEGGTGVDAQLLERVRKVAIDEEESQVQKERRLQVAKQHLLQQALQRREERKREISALRQQARQQNIEKRKEAEELERARAEIESWRNEQWAQLRLISESYEQKAKAAEQQVAFSKTKVEPKATEASAASEEQTAQHEKDNDAEQQKKAKAAAKRKRAKARKKAQKAEERAKEEEKKKAEEISAKKAASMLQCAACGEGILDCGFDKFEQKFCSPKCARTAVRIR